jgi:hypothetical protein
MFDDLRELSESSSIFEEDTGELLETFEQDYGENRFLGLSVGQRFVLSLLVLLIVVVVGSMCLLITGRIWLF